MSSVSTKMICGDPLATDKTTTPCKANEGHARCCHGFRVHSPELRDALVVWIQAGKEPHLLLAPAEIRLLNDLRFLASLSCCLAVRYPYFDLPKQIHPRLRLISPASCLMGLARTVPNGRLVFRH